MTLKRLSTFYYLEVSFFVYLHWVDQHWLKGDIFFQTLADATAKSFNADWNGSYQFADQKKEMKVNSYFQPTYHAR